MEVYDTESFWREMYVVAPVGNAVGVGAGGFFGRLRWRDSGHTSWL